LRGIDSASVRRTAGFVLPLGTTMNMSGTALYEGCVVLFVAQVFGVHHDIAQQITLVFLAVLSAVAVAAIRAGPCTHRGVCSAPSGFHRRGSDHPRRGPGSGT
jgi:Na+/H+-dicarboxylate symporter